MSMFFYYAFHSFINQIRKLFKSWVIVFILVCALGGGVIGFTVGSIMDAQEDTQEEVIEVEEEEEEESGIGDFLAENFTSQEDAFILAATFAITAFLLFEVNGADSDGSKIFLPADAALLFPSPLKPQSVLLFRLATKIGIWLISLLYFLLYFPSVIESMGLSVIQTLGILTTLFTTLATGNLIKMFLYTFASTHLSFKENLSKGFYGVLVALFTLVFAYVHFTGTGIIPALVSLANASWIRFVPFVGWISNLAYFSVYPNITAWLISLLANTACIIGLVFVIWNIKADFYEEALAKSQETAELQEALQKETTGFVRRKKERSEKIKRNEFHYGSGANVFFFKTLYNRFRFAKFGFITKTTALYTVIAAGTLFLFEDDGILISSLALAVMIFFRTLADSLEEDTSRDFFRMIPESADKKIFFSLLGGTVNCLLDLLPALVIAIVLNPTEILTVIGWIPFLVSIHFYGTCTNTFLLLSFPKNAGKSIQQVMQIMFIYFGLLPGGILVAIGLLNDQMLQYGLIATAIHCILGTLFLMFSSLFLDPKDHSIYTYPELTEDEIKQGKKAYSSIGLGTFFFLLTASVVQIILLAVGPAGDSEILLWIKTFLPIYVVGVPVACIFYRKAPIQKIEKHSMNPLDLLKAFIICIFMMYVGNLAGVLVNYLISLIHPVQQAAITEIASTGNVYMKLLFMVICAPVFEEFIFRYQIISRTAQYGTRNAIFISALLFGLFHGNFSQVFYAFTIGLVLGYVFLKTGKLRYTILLHMLINFNGAILGPFLLENIATSMNETMVTRHLIIFAVYLGVMVLLALTGFVLLCVASKKIYFPPVALQLPKKRQFKIIFNNIGMILFLIVSIIMFAFSI